MFSESFGNGAIQGFHAGSGTSHDVISLDDRMAADYKHRFNKWPRHVDNRRRKRHSPFKRGLSVHIDDGKLRVRASRPAHMSSAACIVAATFRKSAPAELHLF